MNRAIPGSMRALVVSSHAEGWSGMRVAQRSVPVPGDDQLLVRVAASPVNPSDLYFTSGTYAIHSQPPFVPGFEGSGLVVAAGSSATAQSLLGKRVAFMAAGSGTWAEYALASALVAVPIPDGISDDQGAMLLINPLTALALMDQARRAGARAVIQTAAASAVGRMILRLGARWSIPVIQIVRRPEQVTLLRELGAEHVISTAEPEWEAQLQGLAKQLDARFAFDAVAGPVGTAVLRAMPRSGRLTIYGRLEPTGFSPEPAQFLFQGKIVDGFWLSTWLRGNSARDWLGELEVLLAGAEPTQVSARVGLEGAVRAIDAYQKEMTRGKVLICPGLS